MAKNNSETWPEHPLFPAEPGDEPQRIEFIQVLRHENGRAFQIPRTFRADELRSAEDIFNLWGGGLYELQGRRSSIHDPNSLGRLSGNRRIQIPGPSKPLVEGDAVPPSTVGIAPMVVQAQPAPASPDSSLMGMFMQMQTMMFQTAQENARQQAEQQRRADERARADNQQMMQMIAQMQATNTQAVMGVVSAVIAGRSGGPDDLVKYAQLFQSLTGKTPPAGVEGVEDGSFIDKLVELTGNAANVVQGAVKLKEAGPVGPPAPPGTAAAVLGVPHVVKPPGGAPSAPPVVP